MDLTIQDHFSYRTEEVYDLSTVRKVLSELIHSVLVLLKGKLIQFQFTKLWN